MHAVSTAVATVIGLLLLSSVAFCFNDVTAKRGDNSNSKSNDDSVAKYDLAKNCASDQHTPLTPITYLTHFSCGQVSQLDNGTTLRKFNMIIHEDIPIALTMGNPETKTKPILYNAWTFNGSIPGPTLRVTKGDLVSINIVNLDKNKFTHSFHMHSIHAGNIDGTMFNNESGAIAPGHNFTYTFVANPVGLWPYHCHQMPLALHIGKGLYGQMIIDPPSSDARPKMTEINMILNGFDLGLQPGTDLPRIPTNEEANKIMAGEDDNVSLPEERDNHIYAANTQAFFYDVHPIAIQLGQPYRLYLTNMLDFDFANTFHLHGQVFKYYPSCTDMSTPMETTDIISMGQGDRGCLEFQYDLPGLYMIHSHFESQAGRGWEGLLKAADYNHQRVTTESQVFNPLTNQIETSTSTK